MDLEDKAGLPENIADLVQIETDNKSPILVERSIEEAILIKHSKDITNKDESNRRLRQPYHKKRCSDDITEQPPNEILYGPHETTVDNNRIKDFKKNRAQAEKFGKLAKELKKTNNARRPGYIRELFLDLLQYKTSLLPSRSAHNNLISTLRAAVFSDTPVEISIYTMESYKKTIVGYKVKRV